jgi:predicted transcriptional regulator
MKLRDFETLAPLKAFLRARLPFMKKDIRRPTEAELRILQVLWDRGPSTVREVYRILNSGKNVGYTTVLKLMQIITDKDLLERDRNCRPQLYRPRLPREQTERDLIKDLVDRAFGGSAKRLVMSGRNRKVGLRPRNGHLRDGKDRSIA